MKRAGKLSLGLVVAVIAAGAVYAWRVEQLATPTIKPELVPLATTAVSRVAPIPWPAYGEGAVGAVGYGVLAQHGSSVPLPTASIAKIMVALCVLQKYPLAPGQSGPTITLTSRDVDLYNEYFAKDGSLVKVAAGEQINEYQALEAMILPSANNMADSLALWAFGSMDTYHACANTYAAQLGLTSTHFASDASGFDPQTVSTASDLVHLGEVALQNPVLAGIVGEQTANVPVAGAIHNVNELLGLDGIIGIKTGNNNQDQGVYLFAARHEVVPGKAVTIVGALMGGPNLVQTMHDGLAIINAAAANFVQTNLVPAGAVVGSYLPAWGLPAEAVTEHGLSAIIWRGTVPKVVVNLKPLSVPAAGHQAIGTISVQPGEGSTLQDTVLLSGNIPAPTLKWRLLHP